MFLWGWEGGLLLARDGGRVLLRCLKVGGM